MTTAMTTTDIVCRMARRDAAVHLIAASTALSVRIRLRVTTCPVCGATEDDARRRPAALPIHGERAGYDWAPESHGNPALHILGCEAVTARALLAVGAAAHHFPELRDAGFRTRAVAAFEWNIPLGSADVLAPMDQAEQWVDSLLVATGAAELPAGFRAPAGLVLPVATRCQSSTTDLPDQLRLHFLGPHADTPRLDGLYLATRMEAVRELGGFPYP